MPLLNASALPRMHTVRQEFPQSDPLEIPAAVAEQISMVQGRLTPAKR
ncbi:uncharacterized protein METZ01_LOCUS288230, partial [marine metagenome]